MDDPLATGFTIIIMICGVIYHTMVTRHLQEVLVM